MSSSLKPQKFRTQTLSHTPLNQYQSQQSVQSNSNYSSNNINNINQNNNNNSFNNNTLSSLSNINKQKTPNKLQSGSNNFNANSASYFKSIKKKSESLSNAQNTLNSLTSYQKKYNNNTQNTQNSDSQYMNPVAQKILSASKVQTSRSPQMRMAANNINNNNNSKNQNQQQLQSFINKGFNSSSNLKSRKNDKTNSSNSKSSISLNKQKSDKSASKSGSNFYSQTQKENQMINSNKNALNNNVNFFSKPDNQINSLLHKNNLKNQKNEQSYDIKQNHQTSVSHQADREDSFDKKYVLTDYNRYNSKDINNKVFQQQPPMTPVPNQNNYNGTNQSQNLHTCSIVSDRSSLKNMFYENNCAKHPNKKAKYVMIAKEAGDTDKYFCSKCAIQFTSEGFQLEAIKLPEEQIKSELIQKFLGFLNDRGPQWQELINCLECKREEVQSYFTKQIAKVENVYQECQKVLEQQKFSIQSMLKQNLDKISEIYEEKSILCNTYFGDYNDINGDIVKNFDNIVNTIELEPFKEIMQSYENKVNEISGFFTNISQEVFKVQKINEPKNLEQICTQMLNISEMNTNLIKKSKYNNNNSHSNTFSNNAASQQTSQVATPVRYQNGQQTNKGYGSNSNQCISPAPNSKIENAYFVGNSEFQVPNNNNKNNKNNINNSNNQNKYENNYDNNVKNSIPHFNNNIVPSNTSSQMDSYAIGTPMSQQNQNSILVSFGNKELLQSAVHSDVSSQQLLTPANVNIQNQNINMQKPQHRKNSSRHLDFQENPNQLNQVQKISQQIDENINQIGNINDNDNNNTPIINNQIDFNTFSKQQFKPEQQNNNQDKDVEKNNNTNKINNQNNSGLNLNSSGPLQLKTSRGSENKSLLGSSNNNNPNTSRYGTHTKNYGSIGQKLQPFMDKIQNSSLLQNTSTSLGKIPNLGLQNTNSSGGNTNTNINNNKNNNISNNIEQLPEKINGSNKKNPIVVNESQKENFMDDYKDDINPLQESTQFEKNPLDSQCQSSSKNPNNNDDYNCGIVPFASKDFSHQSQQSQMPQKSLFQQYSEY